MILADVHTHSSFSSDSEEPLRNIVKAASDKGLKTVCLTEHQDFDYPEGGEFALDVPAYQEELLHVRDEFSDRLEVLFGVELGLLSYMPDTLRDFAKSANFDFIIGSSHQIDGFDPYYPEYFEKMGGKNGILHFFDEMLASVKAFDDFDVLGHLDYIVRYSPEKRYDPLDYREVLDEILKLTVSKGKGIEINSKGVSTLGYPHPHSFVLKRLKELGGEIVTVGSDAHEGARVAADFDKAEQALKAAGFAYYTVFRARKPSFIKL